MRSHPYSGIDPQVVAIARPLIESADGYHEVHAARLVRTAELLVQRLGTARKILELGTSGFVPLVCKSIAPHVTVDVTHFDVTNGPDIECPFTLGDQTITLRTFNLDLEYGTIPVDDGEYDIVVCCEVLEHMEIDPMHMLSEVNRVTAPNGTLLLTTPNITSSRALYKILSGSEPHFYMQYHKNREYHRHNYEYSAPSLKKLLKAAGFSGQIWSEDLFEDGLPAIVEKLRSCGFPVEQPGDNLIAIATKMTTVVDRHPSGIYV